jgi:hypothetical protein
MRRKTRRKNEKIEMKKEKTRRRRWGLKQRNDF